MNEEHAVRLLTKTIRRQFPKTCSTCNRVFPTLKEYLLETRHIGNPVSYDAEFDQYKPFRPLGTMFYSNCGCGNTVVLSSQGMHWLSMWCLMSYARRESERRGVTISDFLAHLRDQIDRKAMTG